MHSTTNGGHAGSQSPHPATLGAVPAQPYAAPSPTKTPTNHRPALLTAAQSAGEVYGISERTFHVMRAKGLVPPPIVIGPRLLRWSRADLEAAVAGLPRKEATTAQPAQLVEGKREKKALREAAGQ